LDALINNQNRIPDEIIVVNGGGENDCQETLEKWRKEFPQLKIIKTKNKNLAASRNVGLPHCKGDLILQTDDDARPFQNWIEEIVKAHKNNPDSGVVGGRVIDASRGNFLSKIADIATFPNHKKVQKVRSVPGVNSSYKKEVIEMIGDYDETLFRGEDVDYNWRAIQSGWDVLYCPEIKVKHLHRPTWKGLFQQHFMYGRAHYLVRKKWPEMYSHYPLKISSIKSLLKWFASWTWTPINDAVQKSSRLTSQMNGFDILVFLFVNLSNRVGTAMQRHFYMV
jgi:cellulose synthase/poly-beta-1,6-N-acetylglucosamine synthase-like glycosyltransferase